jgi:RNA polymerase-binding transcription factor DksA
MLKTEKFKDRLLEDKARLERMINSRRSSVAEHGDNGVNESFSNSGDDEYADAASDTFTQELDVTMLNKYRHRLTQVNAALGRVEEGMYGTCVRCHTKIAEARLDAIPETPFCRDCEADVEVQD